MLSIPGVAVQTLLYESTNSLVYRAIREADNQPVILKLLKESYPTPQELVRYRTEYRITKELKEVGVVQVYGLQKYQNTLVMFIEDFGGESLKIWMQQRQFSLKEFLVLAIATLEITWMDFVRKQDDLSRYNMNLMRKPFTIGSDRLVEFELKEYT